MIGLDTNETDENREIVKSTVKLIIEFIVLIAVFVIILYLPALMQLTNQSVR